MESWTKPIENINQILFYTMYIDVQFNRANFYWIFKNIDDITNIYSQIINMNQIYLLESIVNQKIYPTK